MLLEELQELNEIRDNEVVFDGDVVYLYEAPAEDGPVRGHYSKWHKQDNGRYQQGDAFSGDDGMCYRWFQSAVGNLERTFS